MIYILRRRSNDQRGVSLTETLVAMAIIGFVAAVFLGGMVTSIRGNDMARTRISAESVARSELEYVKSSVYNTAPWSYSLPGSPPSWDATHTGLPSGYDNYSVSVSAAGLTGYNDDIQKITATVYHKGTEIISIETYRTK